MSSIKVSTLIKRMREFYVKRRKPFAQGALYDGHGFCMLGAAACVVTNEKAILGATYGSLFPDEYPDDRTVFEFGHWDQIPNVKGWDVLSAFERFFEGQVGQSVEWFNDHHSRADVLKKLRELEQTALEEGK